jgi:hypothetical protein
MGDNPGSLWGQKGCPLLVDCELLTTGGQAAGASQRETQRQGACNQPSQGLEAGGQALKSNLSVNLES